MGDMILKGLYKDDINLIYYSSKHSLPENILNSPLFDVDLIMERVPIIKKLGARTTIHENISSYDLGYPTEDLLELARLAGRQGRFGRDPRINETSFNQLFDQWITNSINKNLADDVLVYKENNEILGFGSIKIEGPSGYAPLFAVKRKCEGTGISFALMRAIEETLIKNNCTYLKSATQKANKKALAVFERFGFVPQDSLFVYHLWRKL